MSRLTACLILIVVWALTYLTILGSSELRSEEGHRVLPAVHMLYRGNSCVPYIAARPYLNKPPLINWLVAASFKLSGIRNEWTSRLPSALFILAAALALTTLGRSSLGPIGSFIAALCWLTNLGLIEKGRMIEIEAIYCSLFAFALILWLVFWEQKRSPWLTFLVPWIFLGLFIRLSKIADPLQRNVAYGLAWGSIIPFIGVLLIPGTLPRYILPLEAPFCWIVGSAIANGAFQWSIKGIRVPRALVFSLIAIGVIGVMIIFPLRSVTYLKRHERIKPIAAQINALLPSDQRLYAIDPDFQPYLFYVRAPITYLTTLDELPADAHYFLIQPRHQRKFESNPRWRPCGRNSWLIHRPIVTKKACFSPSSTDDGPRTSPRRLAQSNNRQPITEARDASRFAFLFDAIEPARRII